MRRPKSPMLMAIALLAATPLGAQLGLPGAPGLPSLPPLGDVIDGALPNGNDLLHGSVEQVSQALRKARLARIDNLLDRNRAVLERDLDGEPARRGVLMVIDPAPADLAALSAIGFRPGELRAIEELGFGVSEISIPDGLTLSEAQKLIAQRLPQVTVSSDPVYFKSGGVGAASGGNAALVAAVTVPVGIIDGAPAQPVLAIKAFAAGAPYPSDHGSAVVSLLQRVGVRSVLVADVYGRDPAGGNALAIAQGLGWLVGKGARVVSISLVGPNNPVLARAITATRAKGVIVVAAVGNDGPASPPSYPASFPGVVAVTGVDKRNRPLIEAGRALHLDYAAPGADLTASNRNGRWVAVRGTSYAAPLVAARAAAAIAAGNTGGAVIGALDREALALSRQRPDPQTGRGLLCGRCR